MQTHSRACGNLVSIPSVSSTQLQNFWPRPRASKSSNCWECNTVTCGSGKPSLCEWSCEQGLAWFLDMPPSSSSPARAAQAGPGECHTWDTPTEPWGAATGIYNQKPHQESPFPPSSKGKGRKSVQGFNRSWWMVVAALTGPIPKFHQNPGDRCSVGSRGAAKLTVATEPMRNRAKQQGKDFYIRQISPSHLQGAQGAASGIRSGSERCADGICLLPSCCYFLQTGTAKSPSCDSSMRWIGTWFWQLQAWQRAARAGPVGAALPKRWLGTKDKRKRSWSAGALWCVCRRALSSTWKAAQGALPGEESSPLSFSLFHVFPVEPEEHWNHLPPLGDAFEGHWKSTYLGQEPSVAPMAMVGQNECPETGNIWELGIPKHPCSPGDLYSSISTSRQRKDRKSSEKLKITFRLSHKISIKIKT